MVATYRVPVDYSFGTLSQPASVSDTSIGSDNFTSLGTGYSASLVTPIVLHDPSLGTHEVAWITGHASGSPLVTVVRGKEGTTQQPWAKGTQWICAPTAARDGLLADTAADISALTDLQVGARVVETDTGLLKVMTSGAGLQAGAGLALPGDIGKTAANTNVPAGATILTRAGCVIHAVPSSGAIGVTFARPFPNGVIGALAGSINQGDFVGVISCDSQTVAGFTAHPQQLNGVAPGFCTFFYFALGW